MKLIFQRETNAKQQVILVFYAIILIINNIGLVDSFSVVSFLYEGNWNAQKYMTSRK